MNSLKICLSAWAFLTATSPHAQEYQATYQVTFQSYWNPQTHPTQFPPQAHFSQWILHTHNNEGHNWQLNTFATLV